MGDEIFAQNQLKIELQETRRITMAAQVGPEEVETLAPAGHYIALRVGFAFPLVEENALPLLWVDHYTQNRFMLFDPIIRWVYANTGAIRWSEIEIEDSKGILAQARQFGLRYGVAIAVFDGNADGQRSFASFARADREFSDLEIKLLSVYLARRHDEMAPPSNLTSAELEALAQVRNGMRLKEIAHNLGVTEGAVKLRLKNAKAKLEAKTSTQAAALAAKYGLI